MAAQDPCKGLMSRYPAGSPERAAQIAACTEKKRKQAMKQQAAKQAKPPTTTTPPASGSKNDPAWGQIGKLVKNGLPG